MDLSKMSVEQLRELGGCLILPAAFEELARRLAAESAELTRLRTELAEAQAERDLAQERWRLAHETDPSNTFFSVNRLPNLHLVDAWIWWFKTRPGEQPSWAYVRKAKNTASGMEVVYLDGEREGQAVPLEYTKLMWGPPVYLHDSDERADLRAERDTLRQQLAEVTDQRDAAISTMEYATQMVEERGRQLAVAREGLGFIQSLHDSQQPEKALAVARDTARDTLAKLDQMEEKP